MARAGIIPRKRNYSAHGVCSAYAVIRFGNKFFVIQDSENSGFLLPGGNYEAAEMAALNLSQFATDIEEDVSGKFLSRRLSNLGIYNTDREMRTYLGYRSEAKIVPRSGQIRNIERMYFWTVLPLKTYAELEKMTMQRAPTKLMTVKEARKEVRCTTMVKVLREVLERNGNNGHENKIFSPVEK